MCVGVWVWLRGELSYMSRRPAFRPVISDWPQRLAGNARQFWRHVLCRVAVSGALVSLAEVVWGWCLFFLLFCFFFFLFAFFSSFFSSKKKKERRRRRRRRRR